MAEKDTLMFNEPYDVHKTPRTEKEKAELTGQLDMALQRVQEIRNMIDEGTDINKITDTTLAAKENIREFSRILVKQYLGDETVPGLENGDKDAYDNLMFALSKLIK